MAILETFAQDLDERGGIDLSECYFECFEKMVFDSGIMRCFVTA